MKDTFTNLTKISPAKYSKKSKPKVTPPIEPLIFTPHFEEKLWGGQRLKFLFGKNIPSGKHIGESWEVSAVADRQTTVSSGRFAGKSLDALYRNHSYDLIGSTSERYRSFPLLIKFIDAHDRLSIQVHPDDATARLRYKQPFGKTECWYIADAGSNGTLGIGLKKEVSRDELRDAVETGEIENLLNTFSVITGEVYFLPAGTIHAILDDIVIYEVQQNSDTTFRLYDWNRIDSAGKPRALHVDDAVASAETRFRDSYCIPPHIVSSVPVLHQYRAACTFFVLEEFFFITSGDYSFSISGVMRILTFLDGSATLEWNSGICKVDKGTTILIPAILRTITVHGSENCRFLSTIIPENDQSLQRQLIEAGLSLSQISLLNGKRL